MGSAGRGEAEQALVDQDGYELVENPRRVGRLMPEIFAVNTDLVKEDVTGVSLEESAIGASFEPNSMEQNPEDQ